MKQPKFKPKPPLGPKDMLKRNIGRPYELVTRSRTWTGMSLKEYARVIGVHYLSVYRWEKARSVPSDYHLAMVVRFLGARPEATARARAELEAGDALNALHFLTATRAPEEVYP